MRKKFDADADPSQVLYPVVPCFLARWGERLILGLSGGGAVMLTVATSSATAVERFMTWLRGCGDCDVPPSRR